MNIGKSVRRLFQRQKEQPRQARVLDTDYRVFFYEPFCDFCRKFFPIVGRVNVFLDPDRQIRLVDVTDVTSNLPQIFEVRQTPTLYIDGVQMAGVTSEGYVKGFLVGMLEDELNGIHGLDVQESREFISDEIPELMEDETPSWRKGRKMFGRGG